MEQPASYYDEVYSRPVSDYTIPVEEAPWLPLWETAASYAIKGGPCHVVDIGCGPGHFPSILLKRYPTWTEEGGTYTGIDFSSKAIGLGKKVALGLKWILRDLNDDEPIPDADLYVTMEFLEHIHEDLRVMKKLKAGAEIFLTVPNVNDIAHVRYFPELKNAVNRYGQFIDIAYAYQITDEHYAISGKIKG
ncbi:hypothetical protein CMI47_11020 [Candidatus Pacearchaeota archaeon]|nr:hypothetical protein [Candidatus Pacearchaeota archaeon]|tara:strand:- start:2024 stop:2596 length:573 start_codon:yes stop_codon:yes gene_type:complete